MKIVIIGYGPAAIKALEAINTHHNMQESVKYDITVIAPERVKPYAPMFLMDYILGKRQKSEINLGVIFDRTAVNLVLGKSVSKIRDQENKVLLTDGTEIQYDTLLIASGASPIKPEIKGLNKKQVYFLNRLADAQRLARHIKNIGRILIIGGGAIGIEAAAGFTAIGKKVTIIELLEHVLLPVFDEDLCSYIEAKLIEKGINLVLNVKTSEISESRAGVEVFTGNSGISGDIVLVTAGIKPNIEFLNSSNVRVNRGIIINDKMQTNVKNIFAAGDVAEFHSSYEKNLPVYTWYNAIEQGWVAGCNIIGRNNTFQYCPSLVSLKNIGLPVIAIGSKVSQSGTEKIIYTDERNGIFERIYIKANCINNYQSIGVSDKAGMMYEFMRTRKNIQPLKNALIYGKTSPIFLMK